MIDPKDFAPGWAERIAASQIRTHLEIGGQLVGRVPYGTEGPRLTMSSRCRDCGVELGQLHVDTCCVERCPVCMGQAITCGCLVDACLVVTQ